MRGGKVGALAVLFAAMTGQLLLEVILPSRAVPCVYIITLVYLGHRRGYRWRIDGAFWSGLLLGAMLKQPPGAYSLAALLALAAATAVRGSLARHSSLGMLLEVATAAVVFDLVVVILVGRPVLVSLPAYLAPVAWRAALTSFLFLALSLLSGFAGMIPRARART